MTFRILALPGDGIGPEVMAAARKVLNTLALKSGWRFSWREAAIGGAALETEGVPLPDATLEAALGADAVLLGAVGGPAWDGLPGHLRPERGLLQLRRALGTFANLRPIRCEQALAARTPLKPEIVTGTDILFVRELTGGLYFGEKGTDGRGAYDLCRYSEAEVTRVVRLAARLAMTRRRHLTLVDKANVLETSRLWRRVTERVVAREFPDLTLSIQLVDAAAMRLIQAPREFDVIVTENLFGDILTDEASVLAGSIGLIPSASLGEDGMPGLYEPVHGSAPDIAGQGRANPIGMIASLALMLEWSAGRPDLAGMVQNAVAQTLAAGVWTPDLGGRAETMEVAAHVADALAETAQPEPAG